MVDERLVPLHDEESNYLLLQRTIFDQLRKEHKLPEQNLHPFRFDSTAYDKGIAVYEKELMACGGKYDIVVLSAGEDGHVGGLYPRHHSVRSWAPYYLTMQDSPKPPAARMSSSRALLQRSTIAFVLFLGEGKRKAYTLFKEKSLGVEDCPAKIAEKVAQSYVITDLL